jgi:hypothetical protein
MLMIEFAAGDLTLYVQQAGVLMETKQQTQQLNSTLQPACRGPTELLLRLV